jgi:hypothetical protein
MSSLRNATLRQPYIFASKTWEQVKAETIAKCWNETGIHEDVEEKDEFEDISEEGEDIGQLISSLPGVRVCLDRNEVSEWLACDTTLRYKVSTMMIRL